MLEELLTHLNKKTKNIVWQIKEAETFMKNSKRVYFTATATYQDIVVVYNEYVTTDDDLEEWAEWLAKYMIGQLSEKLFKVGQWE